MCTLLVQFFINNLYHNASPESAAFPLLVGWDDQGQRSQSPGSDTEPALWHCQHSGAWCRRDLVLFISFFSPCWPRWSQILRGVGATNLGSSCLLACTLGRAGIWPGYPLWGPHVAPTHRKWLLLGLPAALHWCRLTGRGWLCLSSPKNFCF